jgi:hypothetical protein
MAYYQFIRLKRKGVLIKFIALVALLAILGTLKDV